MWLFYDPILQAITLFFAVLTDVTYLFFFLSTLPLLKDKGCLLSYYCYLHFTDEETKEPQCSVTCSRSGSWQWWCLDLNSFQDLLSTPPLPPVLPYLGLGSQENKAYDQD